GRSRKSARLASPLTAASAASRLHSGQRDSVLLGTPVVIGTLSELFVSGAGAQDGCGKLPAGKIELIFLAKDHAAFDTDRRRLAILEDIINLHCKFAQKWEYRKLQQNARN